MENQNLTKPSSYIAWSILSTLFCCLPFGIVSIVYASKVDGLWYSGHYDDAYRASNSAKNWALAATIIGAVVLVAYIIFVVIAASNPYYYYY